MREIEQQLVSNLVVGMLLPEADLEFVKNLAKHCRGVELSEPIMSFEEYIYRFDDPLTGKIEYLSRIVPQDTVYFKISSSSGTLTNFWEKYIRGRSKPSSSVFPGEVAVAADVKSF